MVEVPVLRATPHNKETATAISKFAVRHGARPHWGQMNQLSAPQAQALYKDGYDTFKKVFQELNPLGYFDNALSERLGLRA